MSLSHQREERRFSRRYGLIITLFLASLLFLLFQGGKLAFMTFIIVTILCIYILIGKWSGIGQASGSRNINGLIAQEPLAAGTTLSIQLNLHIPGVWPIPYIHVKDTLLHRNKGATSFEATFIPDWKRNGEINYQTHPMTRGHYQFKSIDCSTGDVFGVFEHVGKIEMPLSFSVWPETVTIVDWSKLSHMLKGTHHQAITTKSHRETTQINGIREYNYGDRLSRIHWNATARTGTWKSKEFEREAELNTIIVLDRERAKYKNEETFELAVSTAASLLEYGRRNRLSFGLLSVGTTTDFFEPKLGLIHHNAMHNHLIDVEADGPYSLLKVLEERSRSFASGMFTVIISPDKGIETLGALNWVQHKQMNGCQILVGSEAGRDHPAWTHFMQNRGFLGYAISALSELPLQLGGKRL
ncbi:MAG: DUF58 domain-containing protein [Gorillibacterium sp.]|nr:DUF58 domain-containing protein [Gorillibacterium sp.]